MSPAVGVPKLGVFARPLARSPPWLLLALSLSSLFVFSSGDREFLYRTHHGHNWFTASHLAVAANVSMQDRLRLFLRLTPGQDGEPDHDVYSRFPVGGYVLIKLAMLPFDGDLRAEMLAARALMLALFCGAAALSCLALRRIAADPWIALMATLCAFSSFRLLYFSDTVATEMVPDLFGMMLVFHGMVVHAQDGRFAQLAAKTCVALLLGWHVYALLLAFIALGFAVHLVDAVVALRSDRRDASDRLSKRQVAAWVCLRTATRALFRSRLPTVGAVALLFGIAVLGFNFANEHAALKHEVPLAELPSVESMLRRFGQDAEFSAKWEWKLAWPAFLFQQLHAVGTASIPYALPVPKMRRGDLSRKGATGLAVAGIGLLAIGACAFGLLFTRPARHQRRDRVLLGALALSGFVWALSMRHNTAIHEFEGLFYVGTPLAAYTLLFMLAARWRRGWLLPGAVVATLAFVLSVREVGRLNADDKVTDLYRAVQMDFQRIGETTRGRTVFVDNQAVTDFGGPLISLLRPPTLVYYLAGSIPQFDAKGDWPFFSPDWTNRNQRYDLILSGERLERPSLLTPDNQIVFLYDGRPFARAHDFHLPTYRAQYDAITASEPATAATLVAPTAFDVYTENVGSGSNSDGDDGELFFLRSPCVADDTHGVFFVHVFPHKATDLPANRQQYGFDNLDFRFASRGVVFEGKCMASIGLPDYDIARVATGRATSDGGEAWRTVFDVDR